MTEKTEGIRKFRKRNQSNVINDSLIVLSDI